MNEKNLRTETFLGCDKTFDEASVVVFGAPFDATTSYRPGTRFASRVMRSESYGIETYSPYCDKDLDEDASVFDAGDLKLPFGNVEKALTMIKEQTKEILLAKKIPCMIGGEHLVTLGAVEAVLENYPNLHVIHFDAHTDLRDDYIGEKKSHATVLRRIWDLIGDGKIFQFGIRSGEKKEFHWAEKEKHTHLNRFNFHGLEKILETLAEKNVPIYLTIDLDVLDPSQFLGTGTPEAGGVSFIELMRAMSQVLHSHQVVACDIVELAPTLDPSGVSTMTALKILREMLLLLK